MAIQSIKNVHFDNFILSSAAVRTSRLMDREGGGEEWVENCTFNGVEYRRFYVFSDGEIRAAEEDDWLDFDSDHVSKIQEV